MNVIIPRLLAIAVMLTACQSAPTGEASSTATSVPEKLDPKYSVAKDRADLDKIRENIPADVRQQNDEKALLAELTAEVKYSPDVVRDKFATIVRKKRDLFSKDMGKIRDDFNKEEKKKRDDFLKQLQDERDEFSKRKVDRDKRTEFYNEQDETRRNFFAEQRDKREEFESEFRARRKDFDDYIKDKTDIFNEEMKNYSQRWKDKQQAEKNGSQ